MHVKFYSIAAENALLTRLNPSPPVFPQISRRLHHYKPKLTHVNSPHFSADASLLTRPDPIPLDLPQISWRLHDYEP